MNAIEIYAIVKDVPKEAWPPNVSYWDVTGTPHFYRDPISCGEHERMPPVHAELLFEASIMRHLLNGHTAVLNTVSENKAWHTVGVAGFDVVTRATRLEALAAACRAADGGG